MGISISCARLDLGLVAVICLYATAVLTNIKAKMIGEFTLARFGPTEFKTLLAVYGIFLAGLVRLAPESQRPGNWSLGFFILLIVFGVLQLLINLWIGVRDVNAHGAPPDTTEWITNGDSSTRFSMTKSFRIEFIVNFMHDQVYFFRGFQRFGQLRSWTAVLAICFSAAIHPGCRENQVDSSGPSGLSLQPKNSPGAPREKAALPSGICVVLGDTDGNIAIDRARKTN